VQFKPCEFEPTPVELLYDSNFEVPVLFQNGPGHFAYSLRFQQEYRRRFSKEADPNHRVDNTQALQVYADLGPWVSNGPTANIQIATVCKKAGSAIKVRQVHTNGTEVAYIDSEEYATMRQALGIYSESPFCNYWYGAENAFSLEDSLRNVAYNMDGWGRIVRLRPMLSCGLSLSSAPATSMIHSSVTPVPQEHNPPDAGNKVRLASALPYQADGLILKDTATEKLYTLDKTPRRRTAKKALESIHEWTATQRQEITDSQEVPEDLTCILCGSPHDGENMLICDGCEAGFHTYCVRLDEIPEGDWFCDWCTMQPRRPKKSSANVKTDSPRLDDPPYTPPPSPTANDSQPAALMPFPDLWQLAAEEEAEEEEGQAPTTAPLLEIWDDKATLIYLKEGAYNVELLPDDEEEQKRAMKRITKRADAFYWHPPTSKIFKKASTRYPQDREVPHPRVRDALIDQNHRDLGHLGVSKLCSTLLAKYYWRGIYAHVHSRLQMCQACTRTKTLFKQQPELQPLPQSQVWERVALDTMGPYPPTKNKNRYIIVAVDACSKWVEARAVPECTSAATAQFLLEEVVARWGTPKLCCTDQGREFQKEFDALLRTLSIKHNQSAAYNPQANGQAEAVVKSVLHGLQKAVGANPLCWDDKLPYVLLGMRNAKHDTTGFSPHYVLTGRHPALPADRRLLTDHVEEEAPALEAEPISSDKLNKEAGQEGGKEATPMAAEPLVEPGLDPGTEQLLQERAARQDNMATRLQNNVLRAQQKQKKDYRKRHLPLDVEAYMPIGSQVLLNNPPKNKMAKYLSIEGPYELVRYSDEGKTRATLKEARGKTWVVATNRLAPYPAAAAATAGNHTEI
jgi:hypothetical protein